MSKISKAVAADYAVKKNDEARHGSEIVKNFMDGDSYKCDPITTLKLVTASSIYGEPSYYRSSKNSRREERGWVDSLVKDYSVFDDTAWKDNTTEEIMEKVIDDALTCDFGATLNWAVELRKTYNMRLNPQVIMVRAAVHPYRKAFTDSHPGEFNATQRLVMSRADEPASQLAYFIYKHGNKNNLPSILKRSIANKLSNLTPYQVAKYKNAEIGIANAAKIVHANSPVIDELIQTGTVAVAEEQKTWENLRSEGKGWIEIFHTVDMGHMALLRNLRGVFTEVEDRAFSAEYLNKLKSGVLQGKQFPFRYWSAMKAISRASGCHHVPQILDALNECMDIAKANLPHLNGKTMALTDNSGSAWGSFNSEYGSVTIAEIDNLSSVMLASISDEGYVGVFGDELTTLPISKRDGLLTTTEKVTKASEHVGGGTESGIWLFFRDAIDNKVWWDNIVIFSDEQAGHGDLYGTQKDATEYRRRGFACNTSCYTPYINVMDLLMEYRRTVNPKVNFMAVQTAGYDNVVIPENIYRGTIAYGWTGQEARLLKATSNIWDELESCK